MHKFRPAVLVHVIAQILITGILFLVKPLIEIAFDAVNRDCQTAALLEKNAVQFQAVKGVLKILTEVGEIRAFLVRVPVIFPEGSNDFAVRCLGTAVVDE